ncbi:MAG: PQQ-dependent sugar dehydrogenase, partial [Thaumarchaeota archaeon]|nr:PQQ-dependent sugar dehydrogenase [Nitrososphaerota archaeon]
YTEKDNVLADEIILVDKIPGSIIHDGGRLKFGPDEKLYITTGDAGNADSAQDLNSLGGKILRINQDGTIPSDNPFADSPVFSYGHRNPQGLDWDPVTGKLVSTEHGGFAHDEINIVEAGKNYGWPKVIGGEHDPDFVDPILHTGDDTWAPSGATFYDSDNIPEWENKYFVATLRGNHLRMLDLDVESNQVVSSEALFSNFGRLRDASMGPDGNLYILTSNQDGRGSPAKNDDKILRIVAITSTSPSLLKDETIENSEQDKIEEFDYGTNLQTNDISIWVLITAIVIGITIGIFYAIKKTKRK